MSVKKKIAKRSKTFAWNDKMNVFDHQAAPYHRRCPLTFCLAGALIAFSNSGGAILSCVVPMRNGVMQSPALLCVYA